MNRARIGQFAARNASSQCTLPLLSLQRMVICLENEYHIHGVRDMKKLHVLKDTARNLTGLFALSVTGDTALMAYPSSSDIGSVSIYDGMNMVRVPVFGVIYC